MRKPFIAANWKMNHNLEKTIHFFENFPKELGEVKSDEVDIAICVPFVYLAKAAELLNKKNQEFISDIKLGAENVHWEAKGAFTGEISASMLFDIGCTYVIVGHSERRAQFKESSELVTKKAQAVFKNGLLPIICVGETLEEREKDETVKIVKGQLEGSLANLTPAQVEATTIAYEPVWAIGTGRAATPEMAQEVHHMIRNYLKDKYGENVSKNVRIQYGGSVKPANAKELMSQADIDGGLVGGASLKPDSFAQIIKETVNK